MSLPARKISFFWISEDRKPDFGLTNKQRLGIIRFSAGVAELADARDSKSRARKGVWVQVPPPVV